MGTVGAVAIDSQGHIAAATSTGGMSGKAVGRIGDTPQIGSGTYADDLIGGVSTTGMNFIYIKLPFKVVSKQRASVPTATTGFSLAYKTVNMVPTSTSTLLQLSAPQNIKISHTSVNNKAACYLKLPTINFKFDRVSLNASIFIDCK